MTNRYLWVTVFTMSRSGSHAVTGWISSQFDGRVRAGHWGGSHFHPDILTPEQEQDSLKNPGKRDTFLKHTFGELHGVTQRGDPSDPNRLDLISIEQMDMDDFLIFDFPSFEEIRRADDHRWVIVVRDPFNWIASLMKSNGWAWANRPQQVIDRWKKLARQCLGIQDYMNGNPFISVLYNNWFTDPDYRRCIASMIGVPFTDRGLQHVSGRGDGSSFDGLNFQNRAQNMDVLGRWKHYRDDPNYLGIFHSDPELVDLSKALFGFCPL